MTIVLTKNAVIQCGHGGIVQINPGSGKMESATNEVVTESMLMGSPIIGCSIVPPTGSPCTTVLSIVSGQANKLEINGTKAMLSNLVITTNGSNPNSSFVLSPGQIKLEAT